MSHGHSIGILSQADGVWIYLLVFVLILVQELGVPFPVLPSEVALLSAGFLASQGKISLIIMGLLATTATLIGNSTLYFISRKYGRAALDRYGKYVMLHSDRIDRIEGWIGRRGTPILIYGPLVPILRAYVPALAGIFGVPYRFYVVVLTGAALTWSYGMLILGMVLGDHWFDAVTFFKHNMKVGILLAAVVIAIAFIVLRRHRGVARSRAQHWPETVLPPPPRLLRGTTGRLSPKPQDLAPKEEAIS